MNLDITAHAQSVVTRGYTVIPAQVSADRLEALNAAADSALATVSRALASGVKPSYTELNPYVRAARCFYAWDLACRDLLAHDTIHALANAVLGKVRLWDMAVLEAMPMPPEAKLDAFDWHRDFPALLKDERPAYLWIFTCLTDVTADNGATWVLPGSQRDASRTPPASITGLEAKPFDAVQLTAKAGDIIAINPTMLHCVGENRTKLGRRLALVAMCREDRPPLFNHWSMAPPSWRSEMGDRVRAIVRTSALSLAERWDVLPEGWTVVRPSITRRVRRWFHRWRNLVIAASHRWWGHRRVDA